MTRQPGGKPGTAIYRGQPEDKFRTLLKGAKHNFPNKPANCFNGCETMAVPGRCPNQLKMFDL